MGEYHKVIGIDLGTTYSVVAAYSYAKSDVKVIPNKQNEHTTPSVVYIGPNGQVSVGKAAKEKMSREPGNVIFEVKRIMGERNPLGGKAMARAGGRDLDPEFVSAAILKELKACAEKLIGEPIHDAVITVPAYFKEPQKNATAEAAKIARLNPLAIINEPTAAAVAYGLDKGEPQTFVVYDFGGGTFDVSVVRIEDERTATVLGTGGDAHLGGGDIDQQIVDWALRKMREQHGRDFAQDAKLVGKLRLKAEQVKINLCNEGQPQELVLENPTAGIDEISYTITPAEFDVMVKPIMEKTLRQVDVALDSAAKVAGLKIDEVDAFVLVGGSSKIPAVTRLLKERYKKPVKGDLNPDEIVAMGAARFAASFTPSLAPEISDAAPMLDKTATVSAELANTNIKDVVSHTLGIGLIDDIYDALIPKDHVIPHRVVRGGYTTARDNQTSIFVPVFQGDNTKASGNSKIGTVVIDGLSPEPKGTHQFQITFALDANGIFEGSILHVQKNAVTPIKLDRADVGLTQKKRVELAAVLDAGQVPGAQPTTPPPAGAAPAPAADPVDSLVQQASDLVQTLPADRQREMLDAIHKVVQARASGVNVAGAVATLTAMVMRSRN
ncbi:MAG TPA: Hsp70 family protein [Kofleriaceae bacterium]|jgi:molecular chaperone DnaK